MPFVQPKQKGAMPSAEWVMWNSLVNDGEEEATIFAYRWENWRKVRLPDGQIDYNYAVAPELPLSPFSGTFDEPLTHKVRHVRLERTFIVHNGVVSYWNLAFVPEAQLVVISAVKS